MTSEPQSDVSTCRATLGGDGGAVRLDSERESS